MRKFGLFGFDEFDGGVWTGWFGIVCFGSGPSSPFLSVAVSVLSPPSSDGCAKLLS